MISRKSSFLIDFIFLSSLILLIVNDHYLKWTYANWFTGKLSDMAGLILLPILILKLIPHLKAINAICGTALFFIFWKLPVATSFINFYNQFGLIPITRIVDYSDLSCLIILWPVYILLALNDKTNFRIVKSNFIWSKLLLMPAIIALMATSPPLSFYHRYTKAPIYFHKCLSTDLNEVEILNSLQKQGYEVQKDPGMIENDSVNYIYINVEASKSPYYTIDEFIFNGDTLKNISFSIFGKLDKSTIYINGLYEESRFNDQKEKRKFRKTKQRIIKKELFEKALKD
jgi:hypothetical protein